MKTCVRRNSVGKEGASHPLGMRLPFLLWLRSTFCSRLHLIRTVGAGTRKGRGAPRKALCMELSRLPPPVVSLDRWNRDWHRRPLRPAGQECKLKAGERSVRHNLGVLHFIIYPACETLVAFNGMGRGARNLASPICGAAACFDFPRTPNAREPPGFDDPILHGQKRFV